MAQMERVEDSTHSTEGVPDEDDDALRKRLLSRIAVAGVAIVGLLGGLAVYDSLNKPHAPAMPPMAAAPAEPPPAVEEKPAEEKPEHAPATTDEAVPERSETALAPPPAAKPLTAPASPRKAAMKPGEPAIVRSEPKGTAPAHAPASRPLTRTTETARRYLVQVGVFGNHANAEELVTKLQAAGIPAQIESRVQVGPFASRAEADAARAKLKSLGIADGLLVKR